MTTSSVWHALTALPTSHHSKLDAYLIAALANGFADYAIGNRDAPLIPVGFTVKAADGATLQSAVVFVTHLFTGTEDGSRLTTAHLQISSTDRIAHATASVSLPVLLALAQSSSVSEVQLCANLLPERRVPRLATLTSACTSVPAAPPKSGNSNLLVLIDHGCPFAHRALLDTAGNTRVLTIWDQDDEPDFPAASASVPAGFGYGRQILTEALNGFISKATSVSQIDEDLCYRLAEYPALRSRVTHGTFVLGLMAGSFLSPSLSQSSRSERCEDINAREVIFVQLPRTVPIAPDRGSIERYTLDGIRYALACAPDGAQVTAVVDYGTELGPHDGSSWFERALGAMIGQAAATRGIELNICFPAGNSHTAKRHAIIYPYTENSGLYAELGWWIPMGNDSPCHLEIWFDQAQSNFSLQLFAPSESTCEVELDGNMDSIHVGHQKSCIAINKSIAGQRQILIRLDPTTRSTTHKTAAVAGIWRLAIKASSGQPAGPLNVYAAWGGGNPGLPQRQRPSKFFVNMKFKEVVALLGAGTILGSACIDQKHASGSILVIGGHEKWLTMRRSEYSSAGPGRNGRANDYLAPTEETATLPGLLCIGTRSGSTVRARGTSFAAPQVARKIALDGRVSLTVRLPTSAVPRNGKPREEYGEPRVWL